MSYKEAFRENNDRDFRKEFIKDRNLLPKDKPFIVKDRVRNQKSGMNDRNYGKKQQSTHRELSVRTPQTINCSNISGMDRLSSVHRETSASNKRLSAINTKRDTILNTDLIEKESTIENNKQIEKRQHNEASRLANSKHLLVKTFNRYINNPTS